MRENGAAGCRNEPRVKPWICACDDFGDRTRFLADQSKDLLLALHPMAEEMPDILLRLVHGRPVRRIVDSVLALPQLVEALHVHTHVPVGRYHHRGRPAHDMIATEQGPAIGETEMVRGVAGGRYGRKRFAIHLELFAVPECAVRRIISVECSVRAGTNTF